MTSDISVGTAVQSGGRTIVTGTTSGLDTLSLINNAVAANNTRADSLDVRVADNQTEIDAYEVYYGLSNQLQESLESLKSVTSRASTEGNVFSERTGSLSSNGTDPSGLISVTIEQGAPAVSYDIVVEQKAEAFSIGSSVVTDKDADLGSVGSFTIGLDGSDSSTINVLAGQSLQDIVDAINVSSGTSGVEASILKISETDFQMILTGTETNVDVIVETTSGSVLQDLGLVDGTDTFVPAQIIQEAQGSRILLDGATITRNDNNYDDLIEGVSFTLLNADVDTDIVLEIGTDAVAAKTALVALADSYNEFRDFVLQNQEVNSDGTVPDDAVLFSDSLLENMSFSIAKLLTDTREGELSSLDQLGFSFDSSNRLVIDDDIMDDALLNNFDAVEDFFSSEVVIDNSEFGLISDNSNVEDYSFDIVITVDGNGDIATASANGNTNAFEISGTRLIGKVGGLYEGLTFAYIGDTDATISVSSTAGFADQMYNLLEGYTNASDGLIQTEIATIQAQSDEYSEDAADIRERGEVIREQQTLKYAVMEAELTRLESLKSTLSILLGTDE